jgi:hypothetical protein
MSIFELGITNGPLRAALKASAEPQRVWFDTEEGRVEAHLDACEELSDKSIGVTIRGHIASGPYQGRSFIGTYDPRNHKGTLNLTGSP